MAIAKLLATALVFASTLVASGNIVVGSNDDATALRWLQATNAKRCLHGVPPVGWNKAAASSAQNWVDQIDTIKYSENPLLLTYPDGPAIENLAMGAADLEGAVNAWYSEVNNCVSLPGCETVKVAGEDAEDFTAIVWLGVTQIGCAIKVNANEPAKTIYMCRYISGAEVGPWTANIDTQSANDIPGLVYPGVKRHSVLPVTETEASCAAVVQNTVINPELQDLKLAYKPILDAGTTGPPGPAYCNDAPCIPGRKIPYVDSEEGFVPVSIQLLAAIIVLVTVLACLYGCYQLKAALEKD